MDPAIAPVRLRFAEFELDARTLELRREGAALRLGPQPARLLLLLASRHGEMVSREELCQGLWPDGTHVDFDAGLNFAIRQLRAALGDSAEEPRFIETLPRRGYRFLAEVDVRSQGSTLDDPVAMSVPVPTAAPAASASSPPSRSRRASSIGWAVGGALAGVLIFAAVWPRTATTTTVAPAALANAAPRVAVLRFVPRSPEAATVARTLTDALRSELVVMLPEPVSLLAEASLESRAADARTPESLARDLGVHWVVEGAVTVRSARATIDARLLDAHNGTQLWAGRIERPEAALAATSASVDLTTEVARRFAAEMSCAVAREGKAGLAGPRAGLGRAYVLHARRLVRNAGPDGLRDAIAAFDAALALEPANLAASGGVAHAWARLGRWSTGAGRTDAWAHAEHAAARALAPASDVKSGRNGRDGDNETDASDVADGGNVRNDRNRGRADAHLALATVAAFRDGDGAHAGAELRAALAVDPLLAEAHELRSLLLSAAGEVDAAVAAARRAVDCAPESYLARTRRGRALLQAGDLATAQRECAAVVALEPRFAPAHDCLFLVALAAGDDRSAIDARLGGLRAVDAVTVASELERVYGRAGSDGDIDAVWRWDADRYASRVAAGESGLLGLAIAQARLGDTGAATRTLRQAVANDEGGMLEAATHPTLRDLDAVTVGEWGTRYDPEPPGSGTVVVSASAVRR